MSTGGWTAGRRRRAMAAGVAVSMALATPILATPAAAAPAARIVRLGDETLRLLRITPRAGSASVDVAVPWSQAGRTLNLDAFEVSRGDTPVTVTADRLVDRPLLVDLVVDPPADAAAVAALQGAMAEFLDQLDPGARVRLSTPSTTTDLGQDRAAALAALRDLGTPDAAAFTDRLASALGDDVDAAQAPAGIARVAVVSSSTDALASLGNDPVGGALVSGADFAPAVWGRFAAIVRPAPTLDAFDAAMQEIRSSYRITVPGATAGDRLTVQVLTDAGPTRVSGTVPGASAPPPSAAAPAPSAGNDQSGTDPSGTAQSGTAPSEAASVEPADTTAPAADAAAADETSDGGWGPILVAIAVMAVLIALAAIATVRLRRRRPDPTAEPEAAPTHAAMPPPAAAPAPPLAIPPTAARPTAPRPNPTTEQQEPVPVSLVVPTPIPTPTPTPARPRRAPDAAPDAVEVEVVSTSDHFPVPVPVPVVHRLDDTMPPPFDPSTMLSVAARADVPEPMFSPTPEPARTTPLFDTVEVTVPPVAPVFSASINLSTDVRIVRATGSAERAIAELRAVHDADDADAHDGAPRTLAVAMEAAASGWLENRSIGPDEVVRLLDPDRIGADEATTAYADGLVDLLEGPDRNLWDLALAFAERLGHPHVERPEGHYGPPTVATSLVEQVAAVVALGESDFVGRLGGIVGRGLLATWPARTGRLDARPLIVSPSLAAAADGLGAPTVDPTDLIVGLLAVMEDAALRMLRSEQGVAATRERYLREVEKPVSGWSKFVDKSTPVPPGWITAQEPADDIDARLVRLITDEPVVTVEMASARLGAEASAVLDAIVGLVERGWLRPITPDRTGDAPPRWLAHEVLHQATRPFGPGFSPLDPVSIDLTISNPRTVQHARSS